MCGESDAAAGSYRECTRLETHSGPRRVCQDSSVAPRCCARSGREVGALSRCLKFYYCLVVPDVYGPIVIRPIPSVQQSIVVEAADIARYYTRGIVLPSYLCRLVQLLEQRSGGRFLRKFFAGIQQRAQLAPGAGFLADLRQPRRQMIANITVIRRAFGRLLQQAQPLLQAPALDQKPAIGVDDLGAFRRPLVGAFGELDGA